MDFTGLCCGMSAFSWMHFDSLSKKEDAAEKERCGGNNLFYWTLVQRWVTWNRGGMRERSERFKRLKICRNSSHLNHIHRKKRHYTARWLTTGRVSISLLSVSIFEVLRQGRDKKKKSPNWQKKDVTLSKALTSGWRQDPKYQFRTSCFLQHTAKHISYI